MPSDVTPNQVPRRADDRSGESLHVRSKVILSHVAWLLGMKGIKELGDVQIGEEGYKQRFSAASGVPIDVAVAPVEPAKIRVHVGTKPPSNFGIETIGEDGKTMDVSVLSQRVSDGVYHLASAMGIDKPKVPALKDSERDPDVVHRSELNPNAMRGGRPSKSVPTRPHVGDVTRPARESRNLATPIGRKERTRADDMAKPQVPTQVVAMMTNLMLRMKDLGSARGLDDRMQSAIVFAKKGDVDRVVKILRAVDYEMVDRSKKSPDVARVLGGLARDMTDLNAQVRAITDKRKSIEKDGEENDAVARLKAATRPTESLGGGKEPFSAGGSGKAVLARNRGVRVPGESRSNMARLRETIPPNDEFSTKLPTNKLRDFEGLFRKVVDQLLPDLRYKFRFDSNLKAWTFFGTDWAVSFRTELKSNGGVYGWSEIGVKGMFKIKRLDVYEYHASSYDDLAIQIGQHVGDFIRKEGIAKRDMR